MVCNVWDTIKAMRQTDSQRAGKLIGCDWRQNTLLVSPAAGYINWQALLADFHVWYQRLTELWHSLSEGRGTLDHENPISHATCNLAGGKFRRTLENRPDPDDWIGYMSITNLKPSSSATLLCSRSKITFLATDLDWSSASTKLYCLLTQTAVIRKQSATSEDDMEYQRTNCKDQYKTYIHSHKPEGGARQLLR